MMCSLMQFLEQNKQDALRASTLIALDS